MYLNQLFVMLYWCCKETGDAMVTRPSYAEMAVRGKDRLGENNSERPSSDASSEVGSELASEVPCEKQGARSPVLLDRCRQSAVW